MATRKPATSTLLKNALAEIEKLNKAAESSKSSVAYYQGLHQAAKKELDDVHAFFDSVPNVIPRKDPESYSERAAMTRLAQWLATK